jgi:hypothetical protein
MSKFYKLALPVFFLLLVTPAFGQKILEKPVDQWTQSEAMEVLNNSSWSRTHQSNEGAAAASASASLREQSDNRLSGSERGRTERSGGPSPIVMRLHSGLPIRLALTRLNQIAARYDKMDDKAKAKFNDAGRKLLDCAPCQTYYVITLTQFPNPSGEFVEEAIFEGMSVDLMKKNVRLRNEKGEVRELAHFIPPAKRGDSAVFFFSRNDEQGKPFLSKGNTDLSFVFDSNFLTKSNRFAYLIPRQFDFKVSKITVGDNVVF